MTDFFIRCKEVTSSGEPCVSYALVGEELCYVHHPNPPIGLRKDDRYNAKRPPVTFRCPDVASRKKMEEVAEREGMSVSAWVWKTVKARLEEDLP